MKLAVYPAFTVMSLQSRLAYRNQVWSGVFGELVFMFARIAIWISIFGTVGAATVDGVSLNQMITYALLAGPVLYWDYSRLLKDLGTAVKSGDVSVYLLKPLQYPGYLLANHLGNFLFHLLTVTLPVAVIIALTVGLAPPASLFHGLAFLAFWALSFTMLFLLTAIVGLAAFWLMTTDSLDWFFNSIMTLLSGGLVPLWFFPGWLAAIAGHLPFAWVSYYPAAIYIGRFGPDQAALYFVIGLGWAGVLTLFLAWMWSRARHRLIVQGG
jgi:ABC-2 type transport system permease protein